MSRYDEILEVRRMNKLYELLEITQRNVATAERIDKRLEAINEEMAQERKEDNR